MSTSERNGRRLLVFLHVPKTGGRTLENVLRRQYGPEAMFRVKGDFDAEVDRLNGLDPSEHARLRVVHGHMPFGIHERIAEPVIYTTMLRPPVDRVVSHYYFVRRKPSHYLYGPVGSGMSLKEYVETGAGGLTKELDNGQTRALSGWRPDPTGGGACTREMLETAKHNLVEHFGAIGLQDRFDESLLAMRRYFDWSLPLYKRKNVTRNRPRLEEIDAETRRTIERHNELDRELYEFACGQLAARLGDIGPGRRLRVLSFRALNREYNRLRMMRDRVVDLIGTAD